MISLQRRGLIDDYKGYNFRRESMAQDSQGKLIYPHNARFEAGPFGDGAVMVEEGTENLVEGEKDKHKPEGMGRIGIGRLPVGSYTISFNYEVSGGENTPPPYFLLYTAVRVGEVPANQWQGSANSTFEITSESAGKMLYLYGDFWSTASTTRDVFFKDLQLEAKPYATTFTPSTREDESLTVPIEGLLSPEQGTVEMWVNVNDMAKRQTGYNGLFWIQNGQSRLALMHLQDAAKWQLEFRNDSDVGSFLAFSDEETPNGWHLISVTWNQAVAEIYIDHISKGTVLNPNLPSDFGKIMEVGRYVTRYANTTFAHLRLSSIARTQEQLAPLDGPPPVDEWTTLYLSFGGPDNVRAAKSIVI